MNGILIDEVPHLLTVIPSKTINAIHIEDPFDNTHPIMISLKLTRVTSHVDVRKLTHKEYEDQNIFKIELMSKALLWDLLSTEFSRQEKSMFNYRGWFVSHNTPARRQVLINSITSCAYDAADVMDNDSDATVLESFVKISS